MCWFSAFWNLRPARRRTNRFFCSSKARITFGMLGELIGAFNNNAQNDKDENGPFERF
jgi:hypothetical protein